jgi:hypothetical protein
VFADVGGKVEAADRAVTFYMAGNAYATAALAVLEADLPVVA